MVHIENILDRKFTIANDNMSMRPRIIMQIHDELIYEVPFSKDLFSKAQFRSQEEQIQLNKNVFEFAELLNTFMSETIVAQLQLQVPLIANVTIGDNWGSLKSIDSANLRRSHYDTSSNEKGEYRIAESTSKNSTSYDYSSDLIDHASIVGTNTIDDVRCRPDQSSRNNSLNIEAIAGKRSID